MSMLEIKSGMFSTEAGNADAISENIYGAAFEYDVSEVHNADFDMYVPIALRGQTSLPMRFLFSSQTLGTALIDITTYSIVEGSPGSAINVFANNQLTFTSFGGGSLALAYFDIDISNAAPIGATHIIFQMSRDATKAGDTLNDYVMFMNGRTVA
jgi:hypothetical protein